MLKLYGVQRRTLDWYKLLIPELRKAATKAFKSSPILGGNHETAKCNSLSDALNSFDWNATKEGDKFWRDITNSDDYTPILRDNLVSYEEEG